MPLIVLMPFSASAVDADANALFVVAGSKNEREDCAVASCDEDGVSDGLESIGESLNHCALIP